MCDFLSVRLAENRSRIFSLTEKFRDPDSWLEPSAETAETRASLRLSLPDVCQAVGILLSHSHYVHVSSAGIEPAFPPSEGDVLSIIRRGLYKKTRLSVSQCYFILRRGESAFLVEDCIKSSPLSLRADRGGPEGLFSISIHWIATLRSR